MNELVRKRSPGRPPGSGAKPPGQKYRLWSFRLPPELLAELALRVPEKERAAFVRRAIRLALRSQARREAIERQD